jgi:hypothetical protein
MSVIVNKGIAEQLREDIIAYAPLIPYLNGRVYTRPIMRNMGPVDDPSPGSTPEAFDATGRVLLNVSIEEGVSTANSGGPVDSMWGFPTLWLRCRPVLSEKTKMEDVFYLLRRFLHMRQMAMAMNTGCIVRVAGRTGPFDDRAIQDCVVLMVQLQIDGVWEVLS